MAAGASASVARERGEGRCRCDICGYTIAVCQGDLGCVGHWDRVDLSEVVAVTRASRNSPAPRGRASGTSRIIKVIPSPDRAAAFAPFFREHFDTLKIHALMIGGSLEDAEDAAQEAMTQVFNKWSDITSPLAWAKKATWSSLVKARMRNRQRLELEEQSARTNRLGQAEDEVALNLWEDSQWVRQLLDPLPKAQRQVMELAIEQFAPAEIAEVLGKTAATIRANLHKARQTLQKLLKQGGVPQPSTGEVGEREEIR